ncbi:MAG: hypothetical protein ONB24_11715, partial [candidate division KSB1 bacterium]|nr:hypothetical protein [candidate division KSB1 bacterium]
HVVLLPGDEAAYLAGQNADFTFSVDSLARRYEKLGPHHDFFHPAMFSVLYDSLRSVSLLHQVRELAEQGKNIDLAAEYLADFLLWHKMTSGRSHVGVLLKLSFQRFIVFFLIVLATIFALGYWNRKSRCGSGFIIIAGMVGFAVMALNLALLLAFQVAFGYIYAWLAVLSAAFMIGMASSAAFVNQRSEQFAVGTALEQVLIFMILLAFILLPVLEWIGGRLSLYGTLLLFLLSGAAGGAAFAILCARFRLVTGVVDFGGLYAADVIGGGLSALSLSGLAIPLFGLQRSLYCAVLVLLTALALSVSLRR